jgi:hypothetical protein
MHNIRASETADYVQMVHTTALGTAEVTAHNVGVSETADNVVTVHNMTAPVASDTVLNAQCRSI